jgi:uncharacterized small protein (DUF1192 family)
MNPLRKFRTTASDRRARAALVVIEVERRAQALLAQVERMKSELAGLTPSGRAANGHTSAERR